MSLKKVLHPDEWEDYDDRKKRGGSDHRDFACTETWEVDYLVQIIRKHHLNLSDQAVRDAIKSCCQTVAAPRIVFW